MSKIKEKEIYYGRELFKAIKLYLPSVYSIAERRQKNGLIRFKVMRSYGKKYVGIDPFIEIGADAPLKASDLKELCDGAVLKIEEQITQLDNETLS